MADTVPVYDSGVAPTYQASADVTGGQLVAVSGDGTVAPAAAASTKWVGTAGFDAKAGESVTVYKGGVQRATASGAITAGDMVTSAASGRVATNATPGAGQQVAVAVSTAADGETVELDMVR
ncbi:capsid cement protein [Serinicoccus sediminis]|uniref:capsid cement protein n=1 Tax=Serinicoccus sediminis TaxID=2306021 RepID=UPI001020E506|nr:capsid cement protein [Serinicoccus sediminis]